MHAPAEEMEVELATTKSRKKSGIKKYYHLLVGWI